MVEREAQNEGEAEVFVVKFDRGAVTTVPVYCSHRRGKNWLAKIRVDPRAPAGLARQFFPAARGEDFYYLANPSDFAIGDAIEFGADYYSARGNQRRRRWYGVVIAVDETVRIKRCETGNEACRKGEALRRGAR